MKISASNDQGRKSALVTGCSGYIASALIPALRNQGYQVIGADRDTPTDVDLDRFYQGDLADREVSAKAVESSDIVFHLAAAKDDWGISDEQFYHDNVVATRTLLEAGEEAGVRDWVFFSTVSTMGPSEHPLGEDASLDPVTVYGKTKASAEGLFQAFASDHPEARILMMRPSVVFGEGMPSYTNIFRLVDGIHRRRFLMVGDGEQVKTTSYLENLIAATLFLAERRKSGAHPYIYVDHPSLTTGEIVSLVYDQLDRKQPALHLRHHVAASMASVFDLLGGLLHINFPITRDRIEKFCTGTNFSSERIREMGFEQPVSCQDAFARTVEWYLSQHRT